MERIRDHRRPYQVGYAFASSAVGRATPCREDGAGRYRQPWRRTRGCRDRREGELRHWGRGVDAQPPRNGFYAVADVLISTTSVIGSTVSAQEFNSAQAQLNILLANLARAKQVNDTKAILGFEAMVNYYQQRLALLAQQLKPFEFQYQTIDGRTYAASSGNALESGFDPRLLAAGGLPKGLTYGNVVFDVPSKGGVIQMTDPFSGIVGRWKLPAS